MILTILIVDDEKNIREGLGSSFELEGYQVVLAANGDDAIEIIKKQNIDLVVTDLRMPRMTGEELLKKIILSWPTIPVIVLTGHGSIDSAVESMRNGAFDFLTKPVDLDRLNLLTKRALEKRTLVLKQESLLQEINQLSNQKSFLNMIGKSAQMQKIFNQIQQIADSQASVLITGESGVGKELVVKAIHSLSNRKNGSLITVHCASLAESLIESELFGHEEGAFTGAITRKIGRFEAANNGTIFLDEIGEINLSVQVKLLRVLQEREFQRVGGVNDIKVNVRLVSATNKNLKKEVEKGDFREDLYYRINVVEINVPPLRERRDDIPLLAVSFLKEFVAENKKNITGFSKQVFTALLNYQWPGNIRELRNSIESAVVMAKTSQIEIQDLPNRITQNSNKNQILIDSNSTLEEAEKQVILAKLAFCKGNKSDAAVALGIARKTLYRKLEFYGIADQSRD